MPTIARKFAEILSNLNVHPVSLKWHPEMSGAMEAELAGDRIVWAWDETEDGCYEVWLTNSPEYVEDLAEIEGSRVHLSVNYNDSAAHEIANEIMTAATRLMDQFGLTFP